MIPSKHWVLIFSFISCVTPVACSSSDGTDKNISHNTGGTKVLDDHLLGRFSVKVPGDMRLDALSQKFRECEIQEFSWQHNPDHESELSALWKDQIAKIENHELPRGIKDAVIDVRELSGVGSSAKGVFYYRDNISTGRANWKLLIDTGAAGLWLNFRGNISKKEEMLKWIVDIAKSYHPQDARNGVQRGNYFHLKNGFISLPYIEQESTYARFLHQSLDLTLEIDMKETNVDEPKHEGLLARTLATIATGYATGVDIKRLRSERRRVAGLDGEEEVDRMRDKYRTAISFGWRYAGKKDSGEYPKIVIRMESPDGQLDEKLKVWDAVLDSMEPLYKR